MQTVIIAAGLGSRLWPRTDQTPKTLLPFGDGTLLSRIMANFGAAGVREFVIVVGFGAEHIGAYVTAQKSLGYDVRLVHNPDWRRGNGVSVHAAREAVGGGKVPFLLSMSDHLVSPAAIRALIEAPPHNRGNLLLVDPRVDDPAHLEDATRVRLAGGRIVEIGKELRTFNAIDCGVFRLDGRFFDAMKQEMDRGKESLSEGVRALIAQGIFQGVPLPPGADWVDVDTPEAYEYALANAVRFS